MPAKTDVAELHPHPRTMWFGSVRKTPQIRSAAPPPIGVRGCGAELRTSRGEVRKLSAQKESAMTEGDVPATVALSAEWQPPDPLLAIEDDVLTLRWGRGAYDIAMARIQHPEDLLWWLHHLSKKAWPEMTPARIGHLIEAVADHRGWPMYGRVDPQKQEGQHD